MGVCLSIAAVWQSRAQHLQAPPSPQRSIMQAVSHHCTQTSLLSLAAIPLTWNLQTPTKIPSAREIHLHFHSSLIHLLSTSSQRDSANCTAQGISRITEIDTRTLSRGEYETPGPSTCFTTQFIYLRAREALLLVLCPIGSDPATLPLESVLQMRWKERIIPDSINRSMEVSITINRIP